MAGRPTMDQITNTMQRGTATRIRDGRRRIRAGRCQGDRQRVDPMAEHRRASGLLMLNSMATIKVSFGGKPMSLIDLVDAWAQHVLRLYGERNETFESSPDAWGIWDLGAAYIIREALSSGMSGRELERPPALVAVDELLKSFTHTRSPDWKELMNEERGPGWWWDRIPTSGPVLAEYSSAKGT